MRTALVRLLDGTSFVAVCRMLFRPSKLNRWIDQYMVAKSSVYPTAASSHYDWLKIFADMCDKEIVDIDATDIANFQRRIDAMYTTTYSRLAAMRALSCFFRFYRARGFRFLPTIKSHLIVRR